MDQWIQWWQVKMSLGVTAVLYLGVIYSHSERWPWLDVVSWITSEYNLKISRNHLLTTSGKLEGHTDKKAESTKICVHVILYVSCDSRHWFGWAAAGLKKAKFDKFKTSLSGICQFHPSHPSSVLRDIQYNSILLCMCGWIVFKADEKSTK